MNVAVLDRPVVAKPPKELVDFARRQIDNAKAQVHESVERRLELRDLMVLPVHVQPLDADFLPVGRPFDVVTRDLSSKGAGLVHFDQITHHRLALRMCIAKTDVSLVARVLWCRPLGPFYGAGVEFISRLKEFPRIGDATGYALSAKSPQLSQLSLAAQRCTQTTKVLTEDCRPSDD